MSDTREQQRPQHHRPSHSQPQSLTTPPGLATTLATTAAQVDPHATASASTGAAGSPAASGSTEPVHKPWPPRVCGVCGDRAKSYHFGGISCDSCKAFFRRSVQNESKFQCPNRGNCRITLASRKSCQACRFAKCIAIGMESSWVMTEQERRARMQQRQLSKGDRPTSRLGAEDVELLEELVNAYVTGCAYAPFASRFRHDRERSRTELLDLFFTLVQQISGFAQGLDAFARVPEPDRQILLRTSVLEMSFLRSAVNFDGDDRWPSRTQFGAEVTSAPLVCASDVARLIPVDLWALHRKFLVATRRLKPDALTLLLLSAIALLCPDRAGLRDLETLSTGQERYCALLRRYVAWRKMAPVEYAKLLMLLPDLRELADAHTDSDLLFDAKEAADVQRHLSGVMVRGVVVPTQADAMGEAQALPGQQRWKFPGDLQPLSAAESADESGEEESAEESSSQGSSDRSAKARKS